MHHLLKQRKRVEETKHMIKAQRSYPKTIDTKFWTNAKFTNSPMNKNTRLNLEGRIVYLLEIKSKPNGALRLCGSKKTKYNR